MTLTIRPGQWRTRAGLDAPQARRRRAGQIVVVLLALLVLPACMLGSMHAGAGDATLSEVIDVLAAHLGLPSDPVPEVVDAILWDLRAPRVAAAAVFGAALALCGCTLQALTRNPLAEPYLLGISAGASAGAVVVAVLGIGATLGLTGGAVLGGMAALGVLLLLLRRSGLESTRVVLTGVVVGQLFSALMSLILMGAGDAESTRAVTFWLLGSLGNARWETTLVGLGTLLLGSTIIGRHAGSLDALSLGGDTAASLGVHVRRTRLVLMVTVSVLTASAVAVVGAIGFVGLIVPHAMRLVVGPMHRELLPACTVLGALLLVVTDALCRIVFAPREIPVGVITALIGVPVFLAIMRRRGAL